MTSDSLKTGLPATLHTTPFTPLEAAFAQSGIDLPTPYLALSAQVIRDLPLENVAALQRFEALAKSELAALCAMIHAGLELRYADPAKAQRLMREAGHKPEEWGLTPLAA